MSFREHNVLPGFRITLGYTIFYLSAVVLIPLTALLVKSSGIGWNRFVEVVLSEQVIASLKLSFGAALIAAFVNLILGTITALTLARYEFPGRRVLEACIDLPFALPTSVAGISLTTLYTQNGWIGRYLEPYGIKVAYTPIGVVVALIFIGLPFMVRSIQPVIEELPEDLEEAAALLGASPLQTLARVIIPSIIPAAITGFVLSFARAAGEYGSVVFISGNLPYKTEIAPLMIITRLEQYDYTGAAAIAIVMLTISFSLMLAMNLLQRWSARR